jgi:hypothetical protein
MEMLITIHVQSCSSWLVFHGNKYFTGDFIQFISRQSTTETLQKTEFSEKNPLTSRQKIVGEFFGERNQNNATTFSLDEEVEEAFSR